ncbi:hypothetical protein [Pantoea rwandensis]|uniref:Uncharacterized protein n=1 Tax=Pantoea rwandensis TaxID=1076550 RepID=A0A1X1CNV7_9GAMM|nr:hypothetical protein [Pantoea rwandensis]ORM66113.1 hypothetical protein HA51_24040 [Pantoea rwandensis]
MAIHNVLKTIYINNDHDEFLRYEIVGDENDDVSYAMAFVEVKVEHEGFSFSVWSKLDNITLDHLSPKRTGFQTEVRTAPYPGKTISSAIDECKKHRARWSR